MAGVSVSGRKRKKRTVLDASESLVRASDAADGGNNIAPAAGTVRVTRSSRFRNEGPPAPAEASEALQLAMSRSMSLSLNNNEGVVGLPGIRNGCGGGGSGGGGGGGGSGDNGGAAAANDNAASSSPRAIKRVKTDGRGGRGQKQPRRPVIFYLCICFRERERERESRKR